jgi:hypothetical protein
VDAGDLPLGPLKRDSSLIACPDRAVDRLADLPWRGEACPRSACRLRMLNQHSFWLSQMACAGVKWTWTFLCRADQRTCLGLCVEIVQKHVQLPRRIHRHHLVHERECRAVDGGGPTRRRSCPSAAARINRARSAKRLSVLPARTHPSSVEQFSGVRLSAVGYSLMPDHAQIGLHRD